MLRRAFYRYLVLPGFETVYKRRKTFAYWRMLERSQWQDRTTIASRQFHTLQKLLTHAYESCPYYRTTWNTHGIRPEQIQSPDDIGRLPLMTKETIRSHRNELRAEKDVQGALISKSTGGSTGVPLQFDLDQQSYQRRVAAMLRGYSWCGASPGTKQFWLWGIPLQHRNRRQVWKDRVYDLLQRRQLVNSFALNEQAVPEILKHFNRYRPDVVVAYTGALYQFARDLSRCRLKPRPPKAIVVGAEKLHDFQRKEIESVFQAPIYETYGSREFMLIGAECPQHRGLHLTSEHLHVEILNDDGSPTPAGEVGNIVVTDLYNYGMPFVRYLTGDQGIAGFGHCPCGRGLPVLHEVRGRQLDILRSPDGRRTPGEFFPHLIKDFSGVRKFQVVQREPDRVEVRAVLDRSWSTEDENLLLEKIQRQLGPAVRVTWSAQADIPLTQFGKHRVVVNECSPAA